jgi:hypothetical protein
MKSVHPFIYDFDHLAYRMTLEIANIAVSRSRRIRSVNYSIMKTPGESI